MVETCRASRRLWTSRGNFGMILGEIPIRFALKIFSTDPYYSTLELRARVSRVIDSKWHAPFGTQGETCLDHVSAFYFIFHTNDEEKKKERIPTRFFLFTKLLPKYRSLGSTPEAASMYRVVRLNKNIYENEEMGRFDYIERHARISQIQHRSVSSSQRR